MDSFDLVSIGDATWDVFLTPTESETLCQINDKESLLCLAFGDKIPVKSIEFSIGGNAANNAVGMGRLGMKTSTILTLGDDSTGDKIIENFIKEKVDTSLITRQKNSETNYYTIIVAGGERTILGYKIKRDYSFPSELPDTNWVYLTSMAENFQESYQKTIDWVKSEKINLAFNPGSRQIRAGTLALKNVLEITKLLYVNREEAEVLSGVKGQGLNERDLLQKTSDLGPEIVVITDGPNGSFVYDGKRFVRAGVLPVDSYERTGAGDSFGSGFLSAIIKGKSLEEALLCGTVNSASVIGFAGAQKGLLREKDLDEWLERAKSSGVTVEEF